MNTGELGEKINTKITRVLHEYEHVMSCFIYDSTSGSLEKQKDYVLLLATSVNGLQKCVLSEDVIKKVANSLGRSFRTKKREETVKDYLEDLFRSHTDEQCKEYLKKLLCENLDCTLINQILGYCSANAQLWNRKDILDFYNQRFTNGNFEAFQEKVKKATPKRNAVFHSSLSDRKAKAQGEAVKDIQAFKACIDLLPLSGSDDYKRALNEFESTYSEVLKEFSCNPVSKEELESHYGNDVIDAVKFSCLNEDYVGETLYFHDEKEIASIIERMRNDKTIISYEQLNGEFNNESTTSLNDLNHNIELESFRNFNGRYLNNGMLNELAEKTLVLAEAKFWMNEKNSAFISNTLKDIFLNSSNNRRMVLDWGTRLEIFRKLKNLDLQSSKEEISAAKMANSMISIMHTSKYLYYLDQDSENLSSEESIISIAKKNPDILITVFVCNDDLPERIESENLKNIIPLKYLNARNDCVIPSSVREYISINVLKNLSSKNAEPKEQKVNSEQSIDIASSNLIGNEGTSLEKKIPNMEKKSKKKGQKRDRTVSEKYTSKIVNASDIPTQNSIVHTENNKNVILYRMIDGGEGGEGKIYQCSEAGKVVKIYKKTALTEGRLVKLRLMQKNQPNISELCWPEHLIYNSENQLVGYMMKYVRGYEEFGKTILKLNNPTIRSGKMHQWTRLSLVKLCRSLSITFDKMHKKNIFMGDINSRNMLIDINSFDNPKFVFVDCDSYQYENFPCPVGTEIYTSPKMYSRRVDSNKSLYLQVLRNEEDENYAFSSFIFSILMLGTKPFDGKGNSDLHQAMMNYNFAFRNEKNSGAETPDGNARLIWNNTPRRIKDNFTAVFQEAKTISLDTWIHDFKTYVELIRKGQSTNELTPVNYYNFIDDDGKSHVVDIECYECGEKRNETIERYNREEENNEPHLCSQCYSVKMISLNTKIEENCFSCGKRFLTDEWHVMLVEEGFKRNLLCVECRNKFAYRRIRG